MASKFLLFLFLVLILVSQTSQTNSFQSVSQNTKYVNSGTVAIDIASAVSWNPNAVNVTFPFSFSSPVLGVFLTLSNMDINAQSGNLSFYGIVNSYTQTSFLLHVYSNSSQIIASLGYRYMAITLRDSNTYGWILQTVIQAVNISTNPYFDYHSYSKPKNLTVPPDSNQNTSFSASTQYAISLLGYDINCNFFKFHFGIRLAEGWYLNSTNIAAQVSANHYNWQLSQQIPFFNVSTIHFNVLIHNKNLNGNSQLIQSEFLYLSSQDFNNGVYRFSYNGNLRYYGQMYGPATLVALNYTYFGSNNLQFSLSTSDLSISLSSKFSGKTFGMTITKFYTYYCPFGVPYLLDVVCYDICPSGTLKNQTQLSCYNSTPTTNLKTQASEVGYILGYISFFLVLGLIVVIICLAKKLKTIDSTNKIQEQQQLKKNQFGYPIRNQPYSLDNTQLELPGPQVQVYFEPEIGVWKNCQTLQIQKEVCTLCNLQVVPFKTECGHAFHIKCIIESSNKSSQCPTCKKNNLNSKAHRVFCRICQMQQKWIKFNDLKEKQAQRTLTTDLICPACQISS